MDIPHHLQTIQLSYHHQPTIILSLIDQPYNQKVEANIRVSSPEELLREITNV